MIQTKTYPLSAIVGNELTDKERIAELEAQLKHCEGHAAELEAENVRLREAMDKYSEDETLWNLRGELLLSCCIEICQEESADNGTAQKIEARIRALKEEK
jgi:uncharacterized protein (DUF3084 family)